MSWQSDLYDALIADGTVSGLVGTRVFPDVAPGNATVPYIVYQHISETGETPFSGGRGVTFPLVQISCWDDGKAGAVALASAVSGAVEGVNLPGSANASMGFVNQQSTRDQQTKLYGEQIDFRVSANPN